MECVAPWAAIVGRSRDGRVEVITALVEHLLRRGKSVGGVLQVPTDDGYDLVDLAGGGRVRLAERSPNPEMCDWAFQPEAFKVARGWAEGPFDVVILPAARLESAGRGHWATIAAALAEPAGAVVLCIPPQVLPRIALDLPDPIAGLELPVELEAVAEFAATL